MLHLMSMPSRVQLAFWLLILICEALQAQGLSALKNLLWCLGFLQCCLCTFWKLNLAWQQGQNPQFVCRGRGGYICTGSEICICRNSKSTCVCLDVWVHKSHLWPLLNREHGFSSRRGWQHAVKMADSGCLFYSRTIPTQEINWSFPRGFSPVSTSGLMQGRRGEIGAYSLGRSSSCSLGGDGGAGEQRLSDSDSLLRGSSAPWS